MLCTYTTMLQPHTCLCKPGWRGELCTLCVPYWLCPGEEGHAVMGNGIEMGQEEEDQANATAVGACVAPNQVK